MKYIVNSERRITMKKMMILLVTLLTMVMNVQPVMAWTYTKEDFEEEINETRRNANEELVTTDCKEFQIKQC